MESNIHTTTHAISIRVYLGGGGGAAWLLRLLIDCMSYNRDTVPCNRQPPLPRFSLTISGGAHGLYANGCLRAFLHLFLAGSVNEIEMQTTPSCTMIDFS